MMWEYKILYESSSRMDCDTFDAIGQYRWELVSVAFFEGRIVQAVFKRELK